MVSAELALAIPTVLAVLALALGAIQLGVDRVRCAQAAGVGVRAVVRGDPVGQVRSAAGRVAPAGASLSWSRGEVVTFRVEHRARLLGLLDLPVTIEAEAVGRPEVTAGG